MEVIKEKEFHAMTEETANELAKAFEGFGKATKELENTLIDITTAFLEHTKSDLEKQIEYYTKKIESACFITRCGISVSCKSKKTNWKLLIS